MTTRELRDPGFPSTGPSPRLSCHRHEREPHTLHKKFIHGWARHISSFTSQGIHNDPQTPLSQSLSAPMGGWMMACLVPTHTLGQTQPAHPLPQTEIFTDPFLQPRPVQSLKRSFSSPPPPKRPRHSPSCLPSNHPTVPIPSGSHPSSPVNQIIPHGPSAILQVIPSSFPAFHSVPCFALFIPNQTNAPKGEKSKR